MQLSIVVPVYKTEAYLKECLDSLLEQDIYNYEILVVNDGSPDNSQDIIDEYEKKYPTIVKGLKKSNGGLGDARNFAIEKAQGTYITFVDSDDYVKHNSFGMLCSKMQREQLDILVYDFLYVYDDGKVIHKKAMENIGIVEYILSTPNACNKIFKTELFLQHQIRFPKGLWYEDLATIPGIAKFTNKIGYVNKGIYCYRFRNQSIMNQTKYNPKFLDMCDVIDCLSQYLFTEYHEEMEFISILYLYYGSGLKLLPYKKYEELELCLKHHEMMFKNWKKNIHFKKKPILFKMYCYLLARRKFGICRGLMDIRKMIKKLN